MAKITTAERVSREASDNFVFQRSLLAYHAAAQRISGDVLAVSYTHLTLPTICSV